MNRHEAYQARAISCQSKADGLSLRNVRTFQGRLTWLSVPHVVRLRPYHGGPGVVPTLCCMSSPLSDLLSVSLLLHFQIKAKAEKSGDISLFLSSAELDEKTYFIFTFVRLVPGDVLLRLSQKLEGSRFDSFIQKIMEITAPHPNQRTQYTKDINNHKIT